MRPRYNNLATKARQKRIKSATNFRETLIAFRGIEANGPEENFAAAARVLDVLDYGAHMLLYFDELQMMQRIGLQHFLERFAATRVELGFGTPNDPKFQACAVQRQADCDVPDVLGVTWPNRARLLQSVWQSKSTMYFDISDPIMSELRPMLERVRTRVNMARRLDPSKIAACNTN